MSQPANKKIGMKNYQALNEWIEFLDRKLHKKYSQGWNQLAVLKNVQK